MTNYNYDFKHKEKTKGYTSNLDDNDDISGSLSKKVKRKAESAKGEYIQGVFKISV